MKEEQVIIKKSIPVFLFCLLIIAIASIVTKQLSYIMGFILGYGINLVVFKIIAITVDSILLFRSKTAGIFVMFSHIIKMVVYGVGFFLAIKFPSMFNIFAVTAGYFIIKLTIFYHERRRRKRGEGV